MRLREIQNSFSKTNHIIIFGICLIIILTRFIKIHRFICYEVSWQINKYDDITIPLKFFPFPIYFSLIFILLFYFLLFLILLFFLLFFFSLACSSLPSLYSLSPHSPYLSRLTPFSALSSPSSFSTKNAYTHMIASKIKGKAKWIILSLSLSFFLDFLFLISP